MSPPGLGQPDTVEQKYPTVDHPITLHLRREDGAPSNWDRYLDLLAHRGVPEKFRRWYVRRVEEFLKAVRPGSLAGLAAEAVSGYLQEASSRPGLADWQFLQLVDAL